MIELGQPFILYRALNFITELSHFEFCDWLSVSFIVRLQKLIFVVVVVVGCALRSFTGKLAGDGIHSGAVKVSERFMEIGAER